MRILFAASFVLGILALGTLAHAQDNGVPVLKKINPQIQLPDVDIPDNEPVQVTCSGHGDLVNEVCVCDRGYTGENCERKSRKKVVPSELEDTEIMNPPAKNNIPTVNQCTKDLRKSQIANKRKDEEIAALKTALAKATRPGCIDKRFLRTKGGDLVDCYDTGYMCFDGRCETGCNNSEWCAPNYVCQMVPRPGKCVLPKATRMMMYCSDVTEDDL